MEQRINGLTTTRGFAALCVVVFHFGTQVFPFNLFEQFFTGGNLGVSYFFVLSGFVMYWTYHNKTISYSEFVKRRVARIVPLYWFALLLSVVFYYLFASYRVDNYGTQVLLNATFLQAYIPGYPLTVNVPGWTLSVEMFFYLLFPLLLPLAKLNLKRFAIMAVVFYIISQAVHLLLLGNLPETLSPNVHDFLFYNPIWHLNEFVFGIAGYYLYLQMRERGVRIHPLIMAVVIVLAITARPVSLHNGMLAPLFVLFICGLTIKEPAILKWRALVYLGDISYGIYLLQLPVYYYAEKLNTDFLNLNYDIFFYLYLLLLLVCSALSFSYIEKPLRKRINAIRL